MKRTFFAASILAASFGLAAAASADGFSLKDASLADWSGFYVAGSVGYSAANSDFTHRYASGGYDETSTSNISSDGVTGTIGLGYDMEFRPGIILGVFGDYTFGELDGSGVRSYPTPPTLERFNLEYDDIWAIGARVGFAKSASTLWFLTAGYTEADLTMSDDRGTLSRTLNGYFLGGGVEHSIRDGLFLKLEYRYSDYGNNLIGESPGCPTCIERYDTDTDIHSIRLGIAYKFGAPRQAEYVPLK